MKSTYKTRWGHDRKPKSGINFRQNGRRMIAFAYLKKQVLKPFNNDKRRDRMRQEIEILESRIVP